MTLPTDDKARKALPVFDGVLMYFPDAVCAVAEVSRNGNEQHNPGEPLHWARGKSMDQYNTALRHMMDAKTGTRYDTDGGRHLAKAAWRILAALQLDIEQERLEQLSGPMGKVDDVVPAVVAANGEPGWFVGFGYRPAWIEPETMVEWRVIAAGRRGVGEARAELLSWLSTTEYRVKA